MGYFFLILFDKLKHPLKLLSAIGTGAFISTSKEAHNGRPKAFSFFVPHLRELSNQEKEELILIFKLKLVIAKA
ncbi:MULTISPECIES: hypothetical protein [Niastella]|uniref:Uncharacterized protein n=1 Tax=Niastella soli TaxID=2821487 RepID=A0ABS3YUP0_9BACT|nr:hypothetical protein [Niastella soli]MBO9201588.1 hypothetical protein [Niastella soli]